MLPKPRIARFRVTLFRLNSLNRELPLPSTPPARFTLTPPPPPPPPPPLSHSPPHSLRPLFSSPSHACICHDVCEQSSPLLPEDSLSAAISLLRSTQEGAVDDGLAMAVRVLSSKEGEGADVDAALDVYASIKPGTLRQRLEAVPVTGEK